MPQVLGRTDLILALIASVLLRHNAPAAWTIWPQPACRRLANALRAMAALGRGGWVR